MPPAGKRTVSQRSAARGVRDRVQSGGERFWRPSDFVDLPPQAVAQSLSRLAREGLLTRVQRGLYWRPRQTVLGPSQPAASAVVAATARAPLHPAGLTAANRLGLTTQNPMTPEFATSASAAPQSLRGAVVHTRRPPARAELGADEAAVLEVLRDRGRSSDLSPQATVDRLVELVRRPDRYRRLGLAARAEPARVRAILGALGEHAGAPPRAVDALRRSLNPYSRFDFGKFAVLANARAWQAHSGSRGTDLQAKSK